MHHRTQCESYTTTADFPLYHSLLLLLVACRGGRESFPPEQTHLYQLYLDFVLILKTPEGSPSIAKETYTRPQVSLGLWLWQPAGGEVGRNPCVS